MGTVGISAVVSFSNGQVSELGRWGEIGGQVWKSLETGRGWRSCFGPSQYIEGNELAFGGSGSK